MGGPLALLRNGDRVTIDARRRRIDVHLSAAELQPRRRAWKPRAPLCGAGRAGEICRVVSSASEGAVTDCLKLG